MTEPISSLSFDIGTLRDAYASGRLTPAAVIADVYRRVGEAGERPV